MKFLFEFYMTRFAQVAPFDCFVSACAGTRCANAIGAPLLQLLIAISAKVAVRIREIGTRGGVEPPAAKFAIVAHEIRIFALLNSFFRLIFCVNAPCIHTKHDVKNEFNNVNIRSNAITIYPDNSAIRALACLCAHALAR